MKKLTLLPQTSLILTILWLASCSKHSEQLTEPAPLSANSSVEQQAEPLSGAVYAVDGEGLSSVLVSYAGQPVAQTNDLGEFTIPEGLIPEDATLSFTHPEYVSVLKNLSPNLKLDIFLTPKGETIQIDGAAPQKVFFAESGSLSIPAKTFQLATGQIYTGPINLSVSFVDVSDSRQIRAAPGAFVAEDDQGNQRPLQSFGMVELEANTPEGRPLEVRPGASIEISIPLIMEDTPQEVNLYSLNEETGLWDLEGTLTNDGNRLLGEITNTGAWNADQPCADSLICVKVKIEDPNNLGCGVAAEGLSYAGFDGLYTPDADGYVYLNVCPNSVFELQACFPLCIPCPGPVYTAVIDLSTIPINPSGCTDIGVFVLN